MGLHWSIRLYNFKCTILWQIIFILHCVPTTQSQIYLHLFHICTIAKVLFCQAFNKVWFFSTIYEMLYSLAYLHLMEWSGINKPLHFCIFMWTQWGHCLSKIFGTCNLVMKIWNQWDQWKNLSYFFRIPPFPSLKFAWTVLILVM